MKTKIQFNGRHWETGSIHNALALQGIKAPHTGKPYSEALLLGVSGGIAFGYFTFEYKGYLPHIALLTRNTFNPFSTILERLGIAQDVQQTGKPETAEKNLREVLASGCYPLVWADTFSLAYNGLSPDKGMWGMWPVLAIDVEDGSVTIADRSSCPFHVPMDDLTRARGRVKEDKYRLMTLDAPQTTKLTAAVHKGISQTIALFTEEPPRGARDNFGFAAYARLVGMLVNIRSKHGWERYFPAGVRMYHALAGSPVQPGAYQWIMTWGAADGAERGLYADFLLEAAQILHKPALQESAAKFRESHKLWLAFANALLPDEIPLLGESRKLIDQKQDLFCNEGEAALPEIQRINVRHYELLKNSETDFLLSSTDAAGFRTNLRDILLKISAVEQKAVELLQSAIL